MKIKRQTKKERRSKCRKTRQHGINHEAVIAQQYFTKGVSVGSSISKMAMFNAFMDLPKVMPAIMARALSRSGLQIVPEFGWKEDWPGDPDA